jgi:uncharacterized membrane protein YvbJ
MKCKKCGSSFDEETFICPNCGSDIRHQNEPQTFKKKAGKVGNYICIAIVGTFVLLMVIFALLKLTGIDKEDHVEPHVPPVQSIE